MFAIECLANILTYMLAIFSSKSSILSLERSSGKIRRGSLCSLHQHVQNYVFIHGDFIGILGHRQPSHDRSGTH